MVDNYRKSEAADGSPDDIEEKRREKRFTPPDSSRQYVKLQVKNGTESVSANLANFSRSGILFESPLSFKKGQQVTCILTVSLLRSRVVTFDVEVKYCYGNNGSHITGASIDANSDRAWSDVYAEVYDFIVLRQGSG